MNKYTIYKQTKTVDIVCHIVQYDPKQFKNVQLIS